MGGGTRRVGQRRRARRSLSRLMDQPEHAVVIHYSCESFYDRMSACSPRITSIAVANLESAQASSFSIHQMAERQGYPLSEIGAHYDELERLMLDEFYQYVRAHSGYWWVHWNMKNINYGFQALAHRYRVLEGQPVDIEESKLFDLAHVLHDLYGPGYIGHPRLTKLVEKNNISDKDFLSGKEEAEAFEKGDYVRLHFSTLRKVEVIATIARRAEDGSLRTDASCLDMYGSYLHAADEWISQNSLARLTSYVFAVVGFGAAVLQILDWIR